VPTTNQNNTPDIRTTDVPANTTPQPQTETDQINTTYDSMGKNLKTQVDSLIAGLDSDTAAMVQRISDTYSKRITEQKDLNARYLGASRVAGYASGRSRYASELQDNILSKEEQDGLKRVADLEAEREDLIAKAKTARDEKSRAALLDYQNRLIEINKEKRTAIQDLFKNTMDTERLNLDRAKEVRASIKDRIDTSVKTAESIAGAVIDYMDNNGLSKADRDKALTEWADSYGVSEDYLRTAVKDYRREMAKANPSIVQEFEYARDNEGYKGSLLDYQRAKKNAITVSSNLNGGKESMFTFDDARRFDLPETLIGKTDREVILDLKTSVVPPWFIESQMKAGWLKEGYTKDEVQAQWNSFRGTDDIKVLLDTIDTNKAGKDNASGGASDYSAF
jgi:Skp family chaperone for outer membrane proteins